MEFEISPESRLFSLQEAQDLLPLVIKITKQHAQDLLPLQQRLDKMLANDPRRSALESEYETAISQWRGKIERLGVRAVGLWIVEFDVGEGALNWRYPELRIAYFRPEHDTIRKRLTDYIEENDPDWAI